MPRPRLSEGETVRMSLALPATLRAACEDAAGPDGLSAWIRETLEMRLAIVAEAKVEEPEASPPKIAREVDLPAQEEGADKEPDERPRCPTCKVPTADGDLCVDCLVESENPQAAVS